MSGARGRTGAAAGFIPRSSSEVFTHRGARMLSVWTRPEAGDGPLPPFPAVLLLHGFPGSEKNVDVARELLKRAVASLTLHFRGAWGSGGLYRFSHLVEDARAGLRFMSSRPGVDRGRLAAFGFSMGGWTALHLAAGERRLRAVAAVSPSGGPEMLRPDTRELIAHLSKPLRAGSPGALYRDFARSVRRWDPAASVRRVACPLLLVHGRADDIVPPAVSERILRAARQAGVAARIVRAEGARHDFLDRREWLSRLVARWLASNLGGGPRRDAASASARPGDGLRRGASPVRSGGSLAVGAALVP